MYTVKGSLEHKIGQSFVVAVMATIVGLVGQAIGVQWIKLVGMFVAIVCGGIVVVAIVLSLLVISVAILVNLWTGNDI